MSEEFILTGYKKIMSHKFEELDTSFQELYDPEVNINQASRASGGYRTDENSCICSTH